MPEVVEEIIHLLIKFKSKAEQFAIDISKITKENQNEVKEFMEKYGRKKEE
jgi:hypothetical protein